MFGKNELPGPPPLPTYREELEYLYARRSAIDSLIESLEDYSRFRAVRTAESELQTA